MAHIIIQAGSVKGARGTGRLGLGDMIEVIAKPIARVLNMDCLDENEQLKIESPCAKRRDAANRLGRKIGIGLVAFCLLPMFASAQPDATWTADVVVTATDFGINAQAGAQATMTPTAPLRRTYGTNLVTATARTLTLGTTGTAVFSSTLWGNYTLTIPGTTPTVYRLTLGTNSPSPVSAAALVQDPQTLPPNNANLYYTMPQVDALIGGVAGTVATNVPVLVAGANVTITVNGITNIISATGGGGTYVPPSVVLYNDQNVVEIGRTISTTLLTWTTAGATVTNQSLNQGIGTINATNRNYTDTASYTSDRTYTLTVSDGVTPASASTSVYFRWKRYWGVSSSATLSSDDIKGLSGSELATTVGPKAFSVSPSSQYIYYCYPVAWGPSAITAGGFTVNDWGASPGQPPTPQSFQNASGATASYYVYRSPTPMTLSNYPITAN